ncbi:MAG: heme o synthase [Verrucomicrobiota bacterium]|nr:heme o synthase [Verrucomicrobiota bacterium]
MKATAPAIPEPVPQAITTRGYLAIFADLVKARLTALVLLTTLVGYYAGSRAPVDIGLMLHLLAGTALVACGAAALNQFMEREHDARMKRTESRPLPSGELEPETVLIFGGGISIAGLIYLTFAVNPLTALLGALTLISYLLVYTPLKRVTALNTIIGAVPGALPPLMGWTAARNEITGAGWSLFAILFFWQLPHFLAIAWIYKDEYARAGFAMLPVFDRDGRKTANQSVSHTLGLLPVSLCPALFGVSGVIYFLGALVLGGLFCFFAIQFARRLTVSSARTLFLYSIIYLPLLLGLMVFDKIK